MAGWTGVQMQSLTSIARSVSLAGNQWTVSSHARGWNMPPVCIGWAATRKQRGSTSRRSWIRMYWRHRARKLGKIWSLWWCTCARSVGQRRRARACGYEWRAALHGNSQRVSAVLATPTGDTMWDGTCSEPAYGGSASSRPTVSVQMHLEGSLVSLIRKLQEGSRRFAALEDDTEGYGIGSFVAFIRDLGAIFRQLGGHTDEDIGPVWSCSPDPY